MFRSTHIRTKLAAALAVPMAALAVVAGFEVLAAKTQVDEARAQADLAEASLGPGSLVVHLQNERNRTAIDLIGADAAALALPDVVSARGITDPAAAQFRTETDRLGGPVRKAFEPAWAAFDELDELRTDIDAYEGPRSSRNKEFADEVFQRYTTIVDAFFHGTTLVVHYIEDAGLRSGAEIVDAAARQVDTRARIVWTLTQADNTLSLDKALVRQAVAALDERSHSLDTTILASSIGTDAGVADDTFAEAGVQGFNLQIESYLAGKNVEPASLLPSMDSAAKTGYAGLGQSAWALLSADAQQKRADASFRMQLFAAIAAGGLVLALLVTWLASRSITRPLRSLKTQAEDMAGTRLPSAVRQILDTPAGDDVVMPEVVPIEVRTRDEVSEVAAALSQVQSSAVELAVEQAVLRRNISDSYINLGRRNQNLLSRQIDFITDLERNETDPDSLEGLFRLDHLATRMRRNAESLLVLAGIEPPRQWSAPLKVADVVRAALSEVEDYQRCVVRHLEPASVTGAVAADIAHVLAELIENALSFSPPDQSVEVKGRLTTSGYTVAITDNGLGMSVEDVERANRRLAGKESFTVAPSRYLGHYVAGHIASRLGIVVDLESSAGGGIIARIDVPMGLLVDDELGGTLITVPATAPASAPVSVPEPVVAGPNPAAQSTGTTSGGLPRRGERTEPAPIVAVSPQLNDPPPLTYVAPVTPAIPAAEPFRPAPAPEPVAAASTDQAPMTPSRPAGAPAREMAGLPIPGPVGPSLYSSAARAARESAGAWEAPSGLVQRVPGAQRPDLGLSVRTSEPAAPEPARTSPDDVYSFLSNFQSGVARGRADAATDIPTIQEDGQ